MQPNTSSAETSSVGVKVRNDIGANKGKKISNLQKESYIMLMFYQPIKQDPWMNQIVAWLDKPFSHVEIAFDDGFASSIFAGIENTCVLIKNAYALDM